ncbi:MAG: LytTR family DNA-binding domain-containing protein [Cyclobacteriaceae bacterium]
MEISCIAIDDEPLALELLEGYISKTSQLKLVKGFRNPVAAFDFLINHQIDLAFLDIQMPGLSGIDLATTLKATKVPRFIFTTAYREYAVESYELMAIDYLVKPFSFQRFLQSVEKASAALCTNPIKESTGFINIKSEGKTFRLNFAEIEYVESFKDFIKINTTDKSLTCYQHISNFSEQLPADHFLRIHRSFIVNLNKVVSFNATYLQIKGEELPIGRSYKEAVLAVLS